VKRLRKIPLQQAAKERKAENCRDFHFTAITNSLNKKNAKGSH
jgi:hypothetical protein